MTGVHSTKSGEIQGPLWAVPGLELRGGRYPLAVEGRWLGWAEVTNRQAGGAAAIASPELVWAASSRTW